MKCKSRGIALIIAVLTLLILSTLAASAIFVTQAEVWTATNYKRLDQARYAAEAGAQQTINWLVFSYTAPTSFGSFDMTKSPVQYNNQNVVLSAMSGVTGNYPTSSIQTAFNSALLNKTVLGLDVTATYAVTATLLSMKQLTKLGSSTPQALQIWQIVTQGSIGGIRPATVQLVQTIEQSTTPIFSYAAYATSNTCASLNFLSGGSTDSYDSSLGTYAATHLNNDGNLGTPGNLLNQSSLTLNGNLSTPWGSSTGSCPPLSAASGNPVTPSGGFQTLNPPTYPAPPVPLTPNTNFTMSSVIAPGTYGNATGCGGTYHFSTGTYNFNSIDCNSGATFVADSGPVILNIGGVGSSGNALNFQSGLTINSGGTPSNFQILYGGTARLNFQSGASPISALIYAPNAPVDFQSDGNFYGSMIASTINFQSSGALHYDRSLMENVLTLGPYHSRTFNWSKF